MPPRWVAFGVVACVGTTAGLPRPHRPAGQRAARTCWRWRITLWWLDRCRATITNSTGPRGVSWSILGLLAMCVFNMRREGLAIVARHRRRPAARPARPLAHGRPAAGGHARTSRSSVGVVLFQLLLPSALAPAYDDAGLHQTWRKLQGPFRTAFAEQLGLPVAARRGAAARVPARAWPAWSCACGESPRAGRCRWPCSPSGR